MRSIAPISDSPVFTRFSYCRRRDEIGPQEGTDQAATSGQMAALHALLECFGPREIAIGSGFQQLVVFDDCFVQLGHSGLDTLLYLRVSHRSAKSDRIRSEEHTS